MVNPVNLYPAARFHHSWSKLTVIVRHSAKKKGGHVNNGTFRFTFVCHTINNTFMRPANTNNTVANDCCFKGVPAIPPPAPGAAQHPASTSPFISFKMKTRQKMTKRFNIHKTLIYGLLLFVAIGCNGKPGDEEEPLTDPGEAAVARTDSLQVIRFLPYWVANAQFAGYYMAIETGIYEKHGIRLDIIPYQPFATPKDILREGKADFAALWLVNALELKASGVDIVNIAQPSSRSSLMLITKKKNGIETLAQMDGKKAGIWNGYELQPQALFRKNKLRVDIIPIGSTNNLFLMGGVDITIANWFDEYHTILNSGLKEEEINTFFFADYGLNFLEDGIYCQSALRERDPGLCEAFVAATLEGWEYAFSHQEQTLDVVIKYAKASKLPVNRVHQQWMLDRYKDLYAPKENKDFNTMLRQNDYEAIGNVLLESGLIDMIPNYNDFYKPVNRR